jgi:hypothetical protein
MLGHTQFVYNLDITGWRESKYDRILGSILTGD